MLLRLLFLLLVVGLAEAALLFWLVQEAGFFTTIAIVLVAGLAGAALAKRQGFRAWSAIRADLTAGHPPADSVIDGLMILVAGLLLALPGLITDIVAILFLIPRVRARLRRPLLSYLGRRISLRFRGFAARASGRGQVIEAEFRRADAPVIEDYRGARR